MPQFITPSHIKTKKQMANKEKFDLDEFKKLKETQYKKDYLKKTVLNVSKSGIVITNLKIKGSQKRSFFIPLKGVDAAKEAYPALKDHKDSKAAWIAAVKIKPGKKMPDGRAQIILSLTGKGNLPKEDILLAVQPLFDDLSIKVTVANLVEAGSDEENTETPKEDTAPETSTDETTANETSDTTETSTDETTGNEAPLDKNQVAWEAGFDKVEGDIETIKKLQLDGKLSKVKLEINIKNCEASLAKLDASLGKVKIVDGAGKINSLREVLKELRSGGDSTSTKKLTPERRKKINSNMDQIKARLEAITKKLGL